VQDSRLGRDRALREHDRFWRRRRDAAPGAGLKKLMIRRWREGLEHTLFARTACHRMAEVIDAIR
jgi:hypothetical protein